jgi:hypothetical protein
VNLIYTLEGLENLRKLADDTKDPVDKETIMVNIIYLLVEYINHDKIRSKIDEISI